MIGLYLHIPFCLRKCQYCDFFSVAADDYDVSAYVSLLLQHLQWAADNGWTGPIETVYLGGGTPSLLAPEEVSRVLEAIDGHLGLATAPEISMEANPGTVSLQTLTGYRAAGVNRLSLGLQTCNEGQLTDLGRLHDSEEGIASVRHARQAGFDNLSLDLMFALPGQTLADLDEDLNCYLDLAPEHLSCYGLTDEPGTPLHDQVTSGKLSLPDDGLYADAFMMIHERLSAAGFNHYEIANYATPGSECRHNLGYWRRRPCLGIGAGAHSFQPDQWGSRWAVPPDLAAYGQALQNGQQPMQRLEQFDREAALRETIYLALRTRRGISDAELRQRFGCTLQEAFPDAVVATARWLSHEDGRWALTPAGWLLFDRLILPFI